jgi:hypothetical protein
VRVEMAQRLLDHLVGGGEAAAFDLFPNQGLGPGASWMVLIGSDTSTIDRSRREQDGVVVRGCRLPARWTT